MIDIKELIKERRIKHLARKNDKDKLIEYLLKCPNIKEALNYIDDEYLYDLDLKFYEMPIEGYMNIYDYIINTRKRNFISDFSKYNSRSIYIPLILKDKSLYSISKIITKEVLLDKMPNNQTVLEYVIENDESFDLLTTFEVNSKEVAKILYEKGKISVLQNSTYEILLLKIDGDKTVLDILKEHNILPRIRYIKESKSSLFDYNLLPKPDILFKKVGNKTILDLLLEKDFDFKMEINEYVDDEDDWKKILIALISKGELGRLDNVPEKFLTTELVNQNNEKNKAIDFLLDEELPKIVGTTTNEDIIIRYILSGNYNEILYTINEEALIKKIGDNLTTLDLLICYATQNKIDLLDILRPLETRRLITKEVTLILAKYGIYLKSDYKKQIGIKSDTDIYHFIYETEDYTVDKEAEKYINKLRELYNDSKTSPEIIETAINSFKRTYQTDKELAIRDIKTLILFKQKYPKFILEYNPQAGSSFSKPVYFFTENENTKISLKNKYNIETFNHELGHLVSYYLGEEKEPKEVTNLLNSANDDKYKRVIEITEELNQEAEEQLLSEEEYHQIFIEFINAKYGSVEKYKTQIREEFNKLIGSKELVLESLNDGSYSDNVLGALVDAYFDIETVKDKNDLIEQYVSSRMNAEEQIFKEELYRKANVEFLCYENFIDAYYAGSINQYFGIMRREYGQEIKAPLCTHNAMYFLQDSNRQFSELYANYMELKKSPNGQQYIERLKEKTSSEIIMLLEEYDKTLTDNMYNQKKDRSK